MRLTKGWDTNELRCISTECIYEGVDASAPIIIGAFMDKEALTEYIKWLLSQLDDIESDDIDKGTVKTLLLSNLNQRSVLLLSL